MIQLKDQDADQVILELSRKQQEGRLTRQDLVPLLMTPLMSGRKPQVSRIEKSIRLLQTAQELLEKEELLQMESVLYALALKFLTQAELKSIKKEVFHMTILGQMLEEDGIKKGLELAKKAFNLSKQGVPVNEIAEELHLSIEEVKRLLDC